VSEILRVAPKWLDGFVGDANVLQTNHIHSI